MLNLSGSYESSLGFGRKILGKKLKKAVRELAEKGEYIPGAYTGKKLGKEIPVSFEHVLPRSKGGGDGLDNGILAGVEPNQWRDNMDWDKWLKTEAKNHGIEDVAGNIQEHLNTWRKVKTKDIDGNEYVEKVLPTLNHEARGVVKFSGQKLNTQV